MLEKNILIPKPPIKSILHRAASLIISASTKKVRSDRKYLMRHNTYRLLGKARGNRNGCTAALTAYVSGEVSQQIHITHSASCTASFVLRAASCRSLLICARLFETHFLVHPNNFFAKGVHAHKFIVFKLRNRKLRTTRLPVNDSSLTYNPRVRRASPLFLNNFHRLRTAQWCA